MSKNPHYNPSKLHHTPTGFRNLYDYQQPGLREVLRWQRERRKSGGTPLPVDGYASFPVVQPDLQYLHANRSDTTITWIGHVTMLLQIAGLNILTDPVFCRRASPFQFIGPERKVALPVTLAELPRIDVVLLSHNHYDHLDAAAMRTLQQQAGGPPRLFVPLGVDVWMQQRSIQPEATLDWWDERTLQGKNTARDALKISFVPAHHWSSRSLNDRFETLWGGYVVERLGAQPYRFYFAGDSGYSPVFANDLQPRFGHFDLAALPIGAYEPRWFMRNQHVNPEEAVRIHREIHARQSLAIHWGSFELTDEPLDQPPRDLRLALQEQGVAEEDFWVFKHGEMRVLQK